jgi:hypothetical protein
MKDEDHQNPGAGVQGYCPNPQGNMFVASDIRTEIQDWKDFRMYSSTAGACTFDSCTEKLPKACIRLGNG